MRTLNRAAAEALQALPAGAVHACTDITGFGLIGHASEMARASGVTVTHRRGRGAASFDGVLAIAGAEPVRRPGVQPGPLLPTGSRWTRGSTPTGKRSCTTRKPLAVC